MIKFIFLVLSLFIITSCSSDKELSPVTVDKGGNLFVNEFFGLSVTKPEGWYSQNVAETMGLMKSGSEEMAKKDKNFQARLKASLDRTVPVFGFFEHNPGVQGKANPNVLASAENLKNISSVKSGCDYIAEVKKSLAKAPVQYHFEGACRTRSIGGKEFGYLDTSADQSGIKVHQVFYATIDRKYALALVQTYTDDDGRKGTDAIISSLQFSRK
jgi:hypothetical protein